MCYRADTQNQECCGEMSLRGRVGPNLRSRTSSRARLKLDRERTGSTSATSSTDPDLDIFIPTIPCVNQPCTLDLILKYYVPFSYISGSCSYEE